MKSRWILWGILPIFVLLVSACSTVPNTTEESENIADTLSNEGGAVIVAPENSAAVEENHQEAVCEDPFGSTTPAFRTDGWETNFCLHGVPYDEIFSGGPPRDGIPPIDSPRFETVESADNWLEDLEPLIILEINSEVRAYPLQILIWHEIVNDEFNGQPVVVTFCPLCNTALVFARPTINGEVLTFGTSGNLRISDLVMWDRQTESWWQQFNGEAIVGDLTGTKLDFIPSAIISWADFKSKHPDGQVLSIQTGFSRRYDDINSFPFLFTGDLNDRLPPMARVLGILLESGEGGAYSLELLKENRVMNEILVDTPLTIFWKSGTASALDSGSISGTASALDSGSISEGRDVGTTGVFSRSVKDQVLTFIAKEDGTFEDQETNSSWDILGEAIDGPLLGTRLLPLPHHDTFWFAN